MLFRNIPHSDTWLSLSPVQEAGWSGDEKFRVTDASGASLLLRISPPDRFDRRKGEYETLSWVADHVDCNISRPLDFGSCENGVYTLLTWVEGRQAEKLLPTLPPDQQARLGAQAGDILRALHSLPAPADTEPWEQYFTRKMNHKIKQYAACPIREPSCDDFEAYIHENARLIQGRPNAFQHGDYHVGNMVISDDLRLGVIDFERMSFGDPWEEMNRITWSAQCSPVFASALLRAYFQGEPPALFWQLLALYMASNQLSSIPWAIPFGQDQIDVMTRQCREVRQWYPNHYGKGAPNWYK